MEKLKVGCIGMGCRGISMLKPILNMCDNVEVVAVCDLYEDRAQEGAALIKEKKGTEAFVTTDAYELINCENVEAVMIFSAWESHVDLAIASMEAGKYVGVEVGGAYSVNDCFRLVEAYERTKIPCMMLENCCYGQTELAVLHMARQGILGEVVHCSGGYCHDLRDEVAGGIENRHYRLRNYLTRNCENYPTHEFGPIAKVLNINRGNRIVSLSSFSSKSRGMEAYIKENAEKYPHLVDKKFAQGDIVTTVITCADGSTVVLTLDTTLPRCYSRGFTVRGTKGAYFEDGDMLFIDGVDTEHFDSKKYWGKGEKVREEYKHPLWQKYGQKAKEAGHDGMDYMVLSAFFESVQKKALPPIDVYDAATWMSITALSEESIANGGIPVGVPDFTGGKWVLYEKKESNLEFALD